MTVIEFFDKESAIENIASALLCSPERIVFIGSDAQLMDKRTRGYKSILAARGINVEFLFRPVTRNRLNAVTDVLESIISESEECCIDLSGGDELYLVAAGAVYQKYREKTTLRRFNFNCNSVINCDTDGNVIEKSPVMLNVDENVIVYGGRVIYNDEKSIATQRWILNRDFKSDIKTMWEVCKKDRASWNAMTNILARLCSCCFIGQSLTLSVRGDDAREAEKIPSGILYTLEERGIIHNFKTGRGLSFAFKNEQVMKCLTKAGQLLELFIAVTAAELNEGEEPVYNSIGNGVYIDWDGKTNSYSRVEVENEIDVILMKGMIPVFVSCKNGAVDTDELYKLSVVAERFGGKYVRKALVASQLDSMGYRAEYIRARAADMNIDIIEDGDLLNNEKLCEKLRNLWK